MKKRLTDTRHFMFKAQKKERKFKFNQIEYQYNQKAIIESVSMFIHMRINLSSSCILAEDSKQDEDLKDNSMLFKELSFGIKQ